MIHGLMPCALRDTFISPATDVCLYVAVFPEASAFYPTAPSAVHLTYCFTPGSHLPGLSVEAYSVFISASLV